jgi:putative spermidine/putrescine transport system ATP-binding protein
MMIAGFEQPSAGDIEIAGRSIAHVPPYRRNIGMVFQSYALFPHMSAAQNIGFPLEMRGMAKAKRLALADGALKLVGLSEFAGKLPRELSGGQQQRVALARALVFEPDLLLLDEPLGALDRNLREQMQLEITRIHRELGVTMIYVTHDQTEAMTMSDRIVVFNRGRIEQVGPPLSLYAEPVSHFVGSFIGDSNFFDCIVHDPLSRLCKIDGLGRFAAGSAAPGLGQGPARALLRPEAIHILDENAMPQAIETKAVVAGIVNYGDSLLILADTGIGKVRLRTPGPRAKTIEIGMRCRIGFEGAQVHLVAR